MVSGLAEAKQLMTDPRISKDPRRHWQAWIDGRVTTDWSLAKWVSLKNMFTSAGADHSRLRKFVAAGFTMRQVRRLRPEIERLVADLLDGIAQLPPDEPVDLRTAYAEPLPARVICLLFGVPEEQRLPLRRLIAALHDTALPAAAAQEAAGEMYAILADLVATRRAEPGEDLTSALLAAQSAAEGADAITEQELTDTLLHLVAAGYETTATLIDRCVHALLTHPAQLELIREGLYGWEDAVDEILRLDPPAANFLLRYATEDVSIAGELIPRGDAIVVSAMGAGRDERVHGDDADRFDLTRGTRATHVAFGHGVHHCLGAPLGRMEAVIALDSLFAAFPDLRLAVPVDRLEPVSSLVLNGHRELPVLPGPRAGTALSVAGL
nr:cytochrome P450 [Streptomyces coryli]